MKVAAEAYRSNVLKYAAELLQGVQVTNALDVGAGDGWVGYEMRSRGLVDELTAVDVKIRSRSWINIQEYDGVILPFQDRSFDLSYAVDVLHHAPEPLGVLREMMRCTGKYLLLKDHTYSTPLGWLNLCALDELGNRRLGIPSIYKYQRGFDWINFMEGNGFERLSLMHPVAVEDRFWGSQTNRLQFMGLWRRI